jgi:hypothetical protein
MLLRSPDSPGLSPRHLAYGLPVWAALAGVGVARLVRRRVWIAVAAAGVAAAVASPGGIVDPRERTSNAILGGGSGEVAPGTPAAVEEPASWVRATARNGDVLFPYSPVFLAALPEAGDGLGLPYGQAPLLLRTLKRADWPVPGVVLAVPLVDGAVAGRRLAARTQTFTSPDWFLLRLEGPFVDDRALLTAAAEALAAVDRSAVRRDFHFDAYLARNRRVLREALDSSPT